MPSIAERISPTGFCWEWTGTLDVEGYGRVTIHGRQWRAHRAVYEALVGPIPKGLTIDHLCRNRSCVNPDHLEPVTSNENMRRQQHPNRGKTHCIRGHSLEDAYRWRNQRKCRTCSRLRERGGI